MLGRDNWQNGSSLPPVLHNSREIVLSIHSNDPLFARTTRAMGIISLNEGSPVSYLPEILSPAALARGKGSSGSSTGN